MRRTVKRDENSDAGLTRIQNEAEDSRHHWLGVPPVSRKRDRWELLAEKDLISKEIAFSENPQPPFD